MQHSFLDKRRDELLLIGRILLILLFVIYGWKKLTGFAGTVTYMSTTGMPAPAVASGIAVVMELLVGIVLILGFYTRPLSLLLALYTLATALIGHHYWTLAGPERYDAMELFYKNLSIMGGLLFLCATGPGRYSLDKR
jgi:putative oxidoreductase